MDKTLNVVFERKYPCMQEDAETQRFKFGKLDPEGRVLVREITKQQLKAKLQTVEIVRKEFPNVNNHRNLQYNRLVDVIKDTKKADEYVEKFVKDINIMMTTFNTDMKKLQETYNNVLKKLPSMSTDS